jgi:hypothetical protein
MAHTIATPKTIEAWLQALTGAMSIRHRADGSSFYVLSEAAYWQPLRQQLQDVVRAAHRDEMPNDWRWEAINDLANQLLVWSEAEPEPWDADRFRDVSFEVADNLASHSTVMLADWVSDHAARGEFDDPSLVEGLSPSIPTLLRWRQCEELQLMADVLISSFEDLLPD